jgi:hypothetical protein
MAHAAKLRQLWGYRGDRVSGSDNSDSEGGSGGGGGSGSSNNNNNNNSNNNNDNNNNNNGDSSSNGNIDIYNIDVSTEEKFSNDLFCLLVRYAALEGLGWQAAIAQPVMASMAKNFG